MKTHLILSEDWPSMNAAAKETQEYLKEFGVSITFERKEVDISVPEAYETTGSWSRLIFGKTKSLSSYFIFGLFKPQYQNSCDCLGLMVDKRKALYEDDNLAGQQETLGVKQIIEVFCNGGKRKRYGFPDDTYVLIHEILHALADHFGVEDTLHAYLDENPKNLDAYKEILLGRITAKHSPYGLLPTPQKALEALVSHAETLGTPIRITEGYRSPERQNELYKQRPKVTNAKAWESMHQYRVAFDIVFKNEGYSATDAQWKTLANYGKTLGLSWGGDWKEFVDKPHFEMTFGNSLKDFQDGDIDWSRYYDTRVALYPFSKDLYLGVEDLEVKELQKFLNSQGFRVALWGNGSPGKETTYFGALTQAALIRFQRAKGISPAAGYFGPITRKYLSTYTSN